MQAEPCEDEPVQEESTDPSSAPVDESDTQDALQESFPIVELVEIPKNESEESEL